MYQDKTDSPIWLLADIHLSEYTPDITTAFATTLGKLAAQRPAAVYILGDLFDYWLGDDLATAYHKQIARMIRTLAEVCPVYYQHGNRDFLLGSSYAAQSGMILLPERHIITPGGQRVLLEHGDLLCTDDHGYQRLRRALRNPLIQGTWRYLPATFRQRIARRLRTESKRRGARKDSTITDVNSATVEQTMRHHAADILIHGHTHRCNTHYHNSGIRYVLGDWHPCGMILHYAHDTFTFVGTNDL